MIQYQVMSYCKKSKFVLPFVALVAFLVISYSIQPAEIVSSIVLSSIVLFFLMVWICMGYHETTDYVEEQILHCHCPNKVRLYGSKIVFLILIGCCMSAIVSMYPCLMSMMNGNQLFTRELTVWDGFCFFLLSLGASVMAIGFTYLFQPRCIPNRKLGMLLLFAVLIIAMSKVGIMRDYPATTYVLWVVPPITKLGEMLQSMTSVGIKEFAVILLYNIVYGITYLGIGQWRLNKKLY